MGCTEDLVAEHAAVLTALGILDAVAGRLESGRPVDPGDLAEMLEFLGVFVDMCHHTKEEGHLFPAVRRTGGEREAAIVDELRGEHEAARALVASMREAVARYDAGEEGAAADLAEAIRSYGGLLRAHIRREDGEFFPMAEQRLDDETKLELARSYEAVERDVVGEGRHEAFHEMLARQRDTYHADTGRPG